ncbi:hypothetical protein FPOAC2_10540 [Fusarium poae]|jgi:hypothetical protein|uniref:hypothetical protein n=1 Tax=Fusarium poae TaxID=36050 RepID=UPI001CE9CBD1|nr:hypothetical protein FPOAC1_010263 [Fusarium poae]KAG8665467.1 hypothetical protein FPOAC1_010263 [Fusarium poae]
MSYQTLTTEAQAGTIPLRHPDSIIDRPPPPPVPSTDPQLIADDSPSAPKAADHDLFKMAPSEALALLIAGVELLVRITGDVPPTPPPKSPTVPHMSGMQAEKENIVRSYSDRSLTRLRKQAELEAKRLAAKESKPEFKEPEDIDGVQLKPHPGLMSPPPQSEPYVVVGADSQPVNLQHSAITRKFYSKNEPPITINQYLQRLHQFCPMSTAVYLATSLYIQRLAVEERAIPVTRRNAHRLVLAGLRVAMKALEDLSYPHAKMAKVGGVSEAELARLEISFCFLVGFELVVGESRLQKHYELLKDKTSRYHCDNMDVPILTLKPRPRGAVQPAA